MTKDKIILIGGGGHCNSVIDVIEQEKKFEIAGIVDVAEKLGTTVLGYPVIGSDDDLPGLVSTYKNCCITLGHIKSPAMRVKLYAALKSLEACFPVIISPRAYVSRHSQIAEGSVIMHDVVINAGARIGTNCIINTKALIEHDAVVGNHCHISTNATVNGHVTIGDEVFIGSNSVINQALRISSRVTIGSGSVIIGSLDEPGTYVGNPAKSTGQNPA